MKSTLQQIKAKGLAERKKQQEPEIQTIGNANVEACFFRQLKEASLHPRIIKQARQSGTLNLSNRGLSEMPDIVWNVTNLTAEENKALSLSLDANQDDKWWEFVDMTKLILALNSLKSVSSEISNYKKLNILDLHDNCLSSLPDSISELVYLTKLNISRNQFENLPECIFQLKSLKLLFAQNNKLITLNDGIENLSFLEELDVSHNNLKNLPHCVGFLSRVTNLNISHNELSSLPIEIGDLTALKHFDASRNKLKSLPESLKMLRHLEQLYIQHNSISEIPSLTSCSSLKEIHAGYNYIVSLTTEFLETVPTLKILDLRDNKISDVPETICSLQALERLDLTNNDLSNLPYTLGTLPHLKFLALDGNPMRSIRRDIIQRGTVQLLRWLRSRIDDPSVLKRLSNCEIDGSHNESLNIDKFTLKSTKSLSLSNKNLTTLPKDLVESAVEAEIAILDISKNNINQLPDYTELVLSKLTDLNAGSNKLTTIPNFIGIAEHLQFLDLRNNLLQALPADISKLSQLRELNICYNRFHDIPSAIHKLKKLEIILASDNKIENIDVCGLSQLPMLAVLDLHNNNIKIVPPELGNLKQLKSLLLDGNLFRNPRPAILSKGTYALLEFLRSRIAQT